MDRTFKGFDLSGLIVTEAIGVKAVIMASNGASLDYIAQELNQRPKVILKHVSAVTEASYIKSAGLKGLRRDRDQVHKSIGAWVEHKTVINFMDARFRRAAESVGDWT